MSILEDAASAVRARGSQYGHPSLNFDRIARLWTGYLEERLDGPLSTVDVALMSALIKVARLIEDPEHYDSWVDGAGYFDAGWRSIADDDVR